MCNAFRRFDPSTNQIRSASLVATVGVAAIVSRYVPGYSSRPFVGIFPSDGATIETCVGGVEGATCAGAAGALGVGTVATLGLLGPVATADGAVPVATGGAGFVTASAS